MSYPSPATTSSDHEFMLQALKLARKGVYSTSPNPRVGCVIVKDEKIIGEGFHKQAGDAHAEINALNNCTESPAGGTVYVTLEPCSHTGKTGPCVQALIEAKVARVVIAMEDPNPEVNGRGAESLEDAGISVQIGLQEDEAHALNKGFIKRMRAGLPFVFIKSAMSLDGRTAMASGESKWITCPKSREDVQRLRARSCAIVTGVNTVIADNPSLTVRCFENARQPLRVVVDTHLKTPTDAAIVDGTAKTVIATTLDEAELAAKASLYPNAHIWSLPARKGKVDVYALLRRLAREQCNEVMVEAGASVGASFLASGMVDELVIYMSGKIMGSTARPLFNLPIEKMAGKLPISIQDIRAVGDDWRITAKPDPEG